MELGKTRRPQTERTNDGESAIQKNFKRHRHPPNRSCWDGLRSSNMPPCPQNRPSKSNQDDLLRGRCCAPSEGPHIVVGDLYHQAQQVLALLLVGASFQRRGHLLARHRNIEEIRTKMNLDLGFPSRHGHRQVCDASFPIRSKLPENLVVSAIQKRYTSHSVDLGLIWTI